MKIKSLSILGASLLLLAAGGCGSDKSKQDEQSKTLEFESYAFTKIAEQIGGEKLDLPASDLCLVTGQGVLPVKIGDTDITSLRDSLMKMAQVEFPSSGVAMPVVDKNWRITDKPDTIEACNEQYNFLSIALQTPYIIVWQSYMGGYPCGAAHGSYATLYVNYSLRINKILTLGDIFTAGYEPKLTQLLRDKLQNNEAVMADPEEINIPSQWCVTPTGIRFIYGVYEIGPYAAGEIEVDFAVYELDGLLTPEGAKLISPN